MYFSCRSSNRSSLIYETVFFVYFFCKLSLLKHIYALIRGRQCYVLLLCLLHISLPNQHDWLVKKYELVMFIYHTHFIVIIFYQQRLRCISFFISLLIPSAYFIERLYKIKISCNCSTPAIVSFYDEYFCIRLKRNHFLLFHNF